MPAYYLIDVREVKDAAKYGEYKARVTPVVEKFDRRYLVVGGPCEVVEGSCQPVFPVMIQFPTLDDARRYDSEDYRELKRRIADFGIHFLLRHYPRLLFRNSPSRKPRIRAKQRVPRRRPMASTWST